MTDVIDGMARAIFAGAHPGGDPEESTSYHTPVPGKTEMRGEFFAHAWQRYIPSAQAALDYLKQPTPASKPLPEGQGPEMTKEQIEANWKEMQPVWQPILDCLKGDAP